MTIKTITRKCQRPGGFWFEVSPQTIGDYNYYFAEVWYQGRLVAALGSYSTENEAQASVAREYPNAQQVVPGC